MEHMETRHAAGSAGILGRQTNGKEKAKETEVAKADWGVPPGTSQGGPGGITH
jgi:hypothetical protein